LIQVTVQANKMVPK